MRTYELMIMMNPELEEESYEAVTQRISDIVTAHEGEIVQADRWGKRKLAYEVDGHTEGFYVVIILKADNEGITEIDRVLKITEEVLRFLLVRKDK